MKEIQKGCVVKTCSTKLEDERDVIQNEEKFECGILIGYQNR